MAIDLSSYQATVWIWKCEVRTGRVVPGFPIIGPSRYFFFAGGGRTRTGILSKISDHRIGDWSAGPSWYHQLLQWDSEWYFKIATDGYQYNGDPTIQQNIVFYPLFPMLSRASATIGGLAPADAMLLVANVAGLLAIVTLFKLVREEFGDQIALATIALLSFFPASVLLSAGYTEPLELLLIVSFFLVLKQ